MYTSISRIRTLSGFDDTTNITDENIKSKIQTASSMVDGALWYIYSLPIAYRYQNTLEFTGKWTGVDNMDIVINGTTYTVAIADNDTPAMVADKFRFAAMNSTDFVTDSYGMGATVSIISKTTSLTLATAYAEVNITSAPTIEGIGANIGDRVSKYPNVLEQITAQIATALLFIDQYGIESQDTGKDGQNRMDAVDAIIKRLQGTWEDEQRLAIFDDVTHTEIASSTFWLVSSYPNNISDTDPDDPTSPKIFINKKF